MPHVASQVIYHRPSGEIRARELTAKVPPEFLRPTAVLPRRRQPLKAEIPSLSLLVTSPDESRRQLGSDRHVRNASHETPISGVDSVFELPSATSYQETPNSSTYSLPFELEDTSPHPLSHPTSSRFPPKSRGLSPRSAHLPTHHHTSSGASIIKPIISPLETPQSASKSSNSSESRYHLHPRSPAANTNSDQHCGTPKTPDLSVKCTRSQPHLRSDSEGSKCSAELEVPPSTRNTSPPQLQAPATIKSRCELAIETITAIEENNRQLLERALAAEKKVKVLQEMNLTLQNRVAYCDQHHRPKTAPSRERRTASEGTPISAFNTTPARHRPPPLNLTPEMKAISRDYDLAARGSPTRPARRQPEFQAYSEAIDISGPIPGSVVKQQITYNGTPLSNASQVATISLADARRREKPLPSIVPMSPSAVPGFVEMGSRAETCAGEQLDLRKKKTFGYLFRRSKKPA